MRQKVFIVKNLSILLVLIATVFAVSMNSLFLLLQELHA